MVQRLSDLIQLGAGDGLTLASAQATSFPAAANTVYPVAAGVTVTLDASMAAGSWVVLLRGESDWASSAVVVNGGGQAFDGTQANLELQGQAIGAAFHRSATGWDAYVHESAQSYFEALSASFGLDFSTATSVLRATYKPSAEALALVMAVEAAGAKTVFKPGSAPVPIVMASSAPATRMSYKASADPIGMVLGFPAIISGYSWTNTEGETFEAAMSGTYSNAKLGVLDTLITDLKTGLTHSTNTYTALDFLTLHFLDDATDALRWFNSPSTLMTAVNTPTHTPGESYGGNGTSALLDTGFNPAVDGVQYAQNSASIGVWVHTENTGTSEYYVGATDAGFANISGLFNSNVSSDVRSHGPNGGGAVITNAGGTGLWVANRTASAAQQVYKDGSSVGTDTGTSTASTNSNLYLFAANIAGESATNYGDGKISASFAGRGLAPNEQVDLRAALNTAITAWATA